MAFPQVVGSSHGHHTFDTSHPVTLPSASAGQLLIAVLAADEYTNITLPGDWISFFTYNYGTIAVSFCYKTATGSDSLTFTTSDNCSTAHRVIVVDDWSEVDVWGGTTQNSDDSPDPSYHNPNTWGSEDTLWIAACGYGGGTYVSAYPSSHPDNQWQWQAGDCGVGIATKELNAASLDSDPFTLNAAADWLALSIAVRPRTVRQGRVYWSELEVPFNDRRGRVFWSELEVPFNDRRGRVYWSELEVPFNDRRGRVFWSELEVPFNDRRGRVFWSELEVPEASPERRGRVYWSELVIPTPPATPACLHIEDFTLHDVVISDRTRYGVFISDTTC